MRSTQVIWGAIVVVLLSLLLWKWNQLEKEVEDTALMMTTREVLTSANEFKNHWMVRGQPKFIDSDGIEVTFTRLGWPLVLTDGELNCQQWLHLLLPNKGKVYTSPILFDENLMKGKDYRCDYRISNGKMFSILLVNGVFKVNIVKKE